MNIIQQVFERFLRGMAMGLVALANAAVVGMMLVTCADVILRAAGRPIRGSYDLVCLLSVVALACALPYTTALKGHVAVEYFFHKLPHSWRLAVDSAMRALMIAMFVLLAVQCYQHGLRLQRVNELLPTLLWPVFWIPWMIAFSCAMSAVAVLYHLLFPGKAAIRP